MSIEEGDNKARDFGVIFIETSAKAGFNIKVLSILVSHDCKDFEISSNNVGILETCSHSSARFQQHYQEWTHFQQNKVIWLMST